MAATQNSPEEVKWMQAAEADSAEAVGLRKAAVVWAEDSRKAAGSLERQSSAVRS